MLLVDNHRGKNGDPQIMYFPDGAPNGEKTAANGAAPHFRIEINFLGVNSSFAIFFLSSLDEVKYYRGVPLTVAVLRRRDAAETKICAASP